MHPEFSFGGHRLCEKARDQVGGTHKRWDRRDRLAPDGKDSPITGIGHSRGQAWHRQPGSLKRISFAIRLRD